MILQDLPTVFTFLVSKTREIAAVFIVMMQHQIRNNNITSWTENQLRCLDCFSLLSTSKEENIENSLCNPGICDEYLGNVKLSHITKRYW